MKIGFILAVHNKLDDLLAHLEIFKYYQFKHEIIIVYTMDPPELYQEIINKYHNVRIDGYGHYIGPLLCATAGVRKAKELGLDYVVYRNSDDWLFKGEWEYNNFKVMKENDYLCGGYSWLNVGAYHDITLNQLYFNVESFNTTVDDAEGYFRRSMPGYLCEYKMPRWIKKTCTNLSKEFYRVPGREQEPGVGWERKDIMGAFLSKNIRPPIGYWEQLENNNRFFNKEWQLIGSHDVASRLLYWRKLRGEISYSKHIEKEYHFSRFIDAVRNKKLWNLDPGKGDPKRPIAQKIPRLVSRKIF